MKHVFDQLRSGIQVDLAAMKIIPAREDAFEATAARLLRHYDAGDYGDVPKTTGIPVAFIAASFERESASDFERSPAQGDRWDRESVHVPKGRGPFRSWAEAADDAYHLDGLDEVGEGNWTWALAAYYAELFNGFGYRDAHGMRSPYVWAGTNLQRRGKYVADGSFDRTKMDEQLGVVPMMMKLVDMRPSLALPDKWPFPEPLGPVTVTVAPSPAQSPLAVIDVRAIQRALNAQGFGPLVVDGSLGRRTSAALRAFEERHGMVADGLADQETVDALLGG